MTKIPPFSPGHLEAICRILGHTELGLKGSQIGALLQETGVEDTALLQKI